MEETLNLSIELFSTEVVCALITLAGVILANMTSRWTAKETARNEVERQKREWEHDNEVASEQAFLDMTEAVSAYILDSSESKQRAARVKTAVLLTFCEGELASKIEGLYSSLKRRPSPDAEEKLLSVIHSRRNQKNTKHSWFKKLVNLVS